MLKTDTVGDRMLKKDPWRILLMKYSIKLIIFLALLISFFSICGPAYAENGGFEIDEDGVLTDYTGTAKVVNIPSSVTVIGDSAFYDNTDITSIVIPDSVTKICDDAFGDCYNLSKVVIPSSVSYMGSDCFEGCYKLRTAGPAGGNYNIEFGWTDTIPEFAFRYSELVKVVIPETMTSIELNAFAHCYSLQSINLPASITEMGTAVFYNCTNLKTAGPIGGGYDIEFGWTDKIPACAFENMPALESVVLPDSITVIGSEAFYDCGSLKDINIPSQLKLAESYAFHGTALERVEFPEGMEEIGYVSFAFCTNLKEVVFPESVKEIYGGAFEGCTSLKTVTIPESMEVLGYGAFSRCTSLSDIRIYCPYKIVSEHDPFFNDAVKGVIHVPQGDGKEYEQVLNGYLELGEDAWIIEEITAPVTTTTWNYGYGILVEWDKVPGATGYVVYRRAMTGSATDWTKFARWNNTTALSFLDTKVYEGTKYQYGIKAYYGSDPATTTNLGPVGPMSKALVYSKKPNATETTFVENVKNGIAVSWDEVKGATGYVIYRRAWSSTTNGWTDFQRWNNTTDNSWIDTKVYAGTRYQYGVKAYYGSSPKNMSFVGDVGPLKTTVRITTRTAWAEKGTKSREFKVIWDGSSVFSGYQIQYCDNSSFSGATTIKVSDKSVISKVISVEDYGYYYVRVRSYTVFNGMTYFGQWSKPIKI